VRSLGIENWEIMDSSDFEEEVDFLYDFMVFMIFLQKLHPCRTGHQKPIEFLRNN